MSKNLGNQSIDSILASLTDRLSYLNKMSEKGSIIIERDGQITSMSSLSRASNKKKSKAIKEYWWGVRHTFYTDAAARDYAHNLRMISHTYSLASLLFPNPVGVTTGLTALYGYTVADSVDYNANKKGKGVVLEITWALVFKCYPRK
ncbi:MAG: hypothetical protein Q3960_05105 [Lactobacillus sp.]|nr:hypothetical protein [Lactobacillus sp.]